MNKLIFLAIVIFLPYAGKSQSQNIYNLPEIIRIIQLEFGQISEGTIIDFLDSDAINSDRANKLLELRDTLRKRAELNVNRSQNEELKLSINKYTSALIKDFSAFFRKVTGLEVINNGATITEEINEIDQAIDKLNNLLSEECSKQFATPFQNLRKKIESILKSAKNTNDINLKIYKFNQESHTDKCTKIRESGILEDLKSNEKVIEQLDTYIADQEAIKNELFFQVEYSCLFSLQTLNKNGTLENITNTHISPLIKKIERIRDRFKINKQEIFKLNCESNDPSANGLDNNCLSRMSNYIESLKEINRSIAAYNLKIKKETEFYSASPELACNNFELLKKLFKDDRMSGILNYCEYESHFEDLLILNDKLFIEELEAQNCQYKSNTSDFLEKTKTHHSESIALQAQLCAYKKELEFLVSDPDCKNKNEDKIICEGEGKIIKNGECVCDDDHVKDDSGNCVKIEDLIEQKPISDCKKMSEALQVQLFQENQVIDILEQSTTDYIQIANTYFANTAGNHCCNPIIIQSINYLKEKEIEIEARLYDLELSLLESIYTYKAQCGDTLRKYLPGIEALRTQMQNFLGNVNDLKEKWESYNCTDEELNYFGGMANFNIYNIKDIVAGATGLEIPCDGLDNDGDGEIDENDTLQEETGPDREVTQTTYYVVRLHGTGVRKLWGGNCAQWIGGDQLFIFTIQPGNSIQKANDDWTNALLASSDFFCAETLPRTCPCQPWPDIWTSGPFLEILDSSLNVTELRNQYGCSNNSYHGTPGYLCINWQEIPVRGWDPIPVNCK